jgi:hypothetical protein
MGGQGARRKRNWRHNQPLSPYSPYYFTTKPLALSSLQDDVEPPVEQAQQQDMPSTAAAAVQVLFSLSAALNSCWWAVVSTRKQVFLY